METNVQEVVNLGASVLLLVGGIGTVGLIFALLRYIKSHAKNVLIRDLAEQAYAWAEIEGEHFEGSDKAKMAAAKLRELLELRGITLSEERILSLVKLAWTVLEGYVKSGTRK